jgi:hypothetical protein
MASDCDRSYRARLCRCSVRSFPGELGATGGNAPNEGSSGISALVGVGVVLLVALFVVSVRVEVVAGVATLAAGMALASYLIVNR